MEMIPAREPPVSSVGLIAWLRRNLFANIADSIVSVVLGIVLVWAGYGLVSWVLTSASWGPLWENMRLLFVYRYPVDLTWRPITVAALFLSLLGLSAGASTGNDKGNIIRGVFVSMFGVVLLATVVALFNWPSVRWLWLAASTAATLAYFLGRARPDLNRFLPWLWGASIPATVVLLYGVWNSGPLQVVGTRMWGGFMLTLVLAVVGIVLSFPIGVALALGRRSQLPAIKYTCIAFIEIVRGAPLITWLFIASLMVPLVFNVGPDAIDPLVRGFVAITLFSAAYMAENVRGGLQAVPRGQNEAARALGLSGWQTMSVIVLPQALRAVLPAIVGQAIGLFKDTSLVFIVGLFDFFEIGRRIIPNQSASLQIPGGVYMEMSLFMTVVYFFFAWRMSIASRQLEKQLGVGER